MKAPRGRQITLTEDAILRVLRQAVGEGFITIAKKRHALECVVQLLRNEYQRSLENNGLPISNREPIVGKAAEVVADKELGVVELWFPGVPSEEVRDKMKTAKWRWNPIAKCWHTKWSQKALELAMSIAEADLPF